MKKVGDSGEGDVDVEDSKNESAEDTDEKN